VSDTKFLGIYIDENLNWKRHVSEIYARVSKSVGMLNRVKKFLSKACLKMLYDSFILSQIVYCNIIWGWASNTTLEKLKILQKRAVRIINHSQYRESTKQIFKSLNILKLVNLHRLQVLLFIFRSKNNLLPLACSHHVKIADLPNIEINYNLRHRNEFQELSFRTIARENYIAISGTKMWSRLPENLKTIKSICQFKRELCNYIIDQY